MILLDERPLDAMLGPEVLAERLDEEAALVAVRRRLEEDEVRDLRLDPGDTHDNLVPYWRS